MPLQNEPKKYVSTINYKFWSQNKQVVCKHGKLLLYANALIELKDINSLTKILGYIIHHLIGNDQLNKDEQKLHHSRISDPLNHN